MVYSDETELSGRDSHHDDSGMLSIVEGSMFCIVLVDDTSGIYVLAGVEGSGTEGATDEDFELAFELLFFEEVLSSSLLFEDVP